MRNQKIITEIIYTPLNMMSSLFDYIQFFCKTFLNKQGIPVSEKAKSVSIALYLDNSAYYRLSVEILKFEVGFMVA